MANYGNVAVRAAALAQDSRYDPESAWRRAAAAFLTSKASQDKSCPKGAFLGLCEEGMVKAIPRGDYTRSLKNKGYAVRAVRAIRHEPGLIKDWSRLWLLALGAEGYKAHNGQMDVVIALWGSGLIV